MLKSTLALAAGAAFVTSPALAADQKKPPVDKSQKLECRDMQGVGSHIPDRICKTRAEWQQEANDAQHTIDNIATKGQSSTHGLAPGQVSAGGPQ
jgi:hypothetical protein